MKRFDEFKICDSFYSTTSISENEIEAYLNFAKIRNVFLNNHTGNKRIVPGRAILARIEGEFTRLDQIYGNNIILIGADGEQTWGNRSIRFLNPLYADQILNIKFTVSEKTDVDDTVGRLAIDYEGTVQNGDTIVIAKRNIYQFTKTNNNSA